MTVHFSPQGQGLWLDSDEFSTEFLKLLGAAQEGGSMVSECFLVASRIDPNDRANTASANRPPAAEGDVAAVRLVSAGRTGL